jgi:hypothetical protein
MDMLGVSDRVFNDKRYKLRPSPVVSGDNARQETRQEIHVVNGRSVSLGHAEVKSTNRGAKSPLDGLSIELVKQLSAMRHLTS